MLLAHSPLWHYLWVAPQVLALGLVAFMWHRGLHRQFPAFFSYLVANSAQELLLYALDQAPSVGSSTWWHVYSAGAVAVGLVRFAVISEILEHLLYRWRLLARMGRNFITGVAVLLILLAAAQVAFRDPGDTNAFVYFTRVLQQSLYLVHAGIIVAVFIFAAYFHVHWERIPYGIALGFAVFLCEHLATWTISLTNIANSTRPSLDMANMAGYHLAVLIWWYYVAVQVPEADPPEPPHDPNLDVWNHELERILQS